MATTDEMRREKARNLRYRKAVAAGLNLETIRDSLYEMSAACDDVRYFMSDEGSTLLDSLVGDEEEAYELRMAVSMLSGDCDDMLADLEHVWVPEWFDDFFGAINDSGRGRMLGYDSYEGDYFGLEPGYEEQLASQECEKRVARATKKDMMDGARVCFRVVVNFLGLQARYDSLSAALDILRGENTGVLQTVKRLEELYELTDTDYPDQTLLWQFDRLAATLPAETWVQ